MEPIPHLEDLIISGNSSFRAFANGAGVVAFKELSPSVVLMSLITRYKLSALSKCLS